MGIFINKKHYTFFFQLHLRQDHTNNKKVKIVIIIKDIMK